MSLGGDPLVWGSGKNVTDLEGLDAPFVKFQPSLCARCNNQRSQKSDLAWARFTDFLWKNENTANDETFDMREVFGGGWAVGGRNVARYVVKHLGCRIVESGFAPPPPFVGFLDGAPRAEESQVFLCRSPARYAFEKQAVLDGLDGRGYWLPPQSGRLDPSGTSLVEYASAVLVGAVGVAVWWSSSLKAASGFFEHPRTPLVAID